MHSRRRLDPSALAELEDLDATLRGDREDPELSLVAAVARGDAAAMTPEFAARLDDAAARGFAAEAGPTVASRPAAPRFGRVRVGRPPVAILGLAASAAVALVVVAVHGGPSPSSPSRPPLPSGAADSAPASGFGVQDGATAPEAAAGGDAASRSAVAPGRRVQRGADLTVATPVGHLQDTADQVGAIADRVGGYVARSSVSAAGDGGQASYDLRVPVARTDEALAALARLGHVRSRSQSSRDVTGGYNAAAARLHDARAERQALLRALASATTQPAIDSLHARLDIARRAIDSAKAALSALARASDNTRIGVTILGVPNSSGGGTPRGSGPWTPRRALHDAVRVLSTAAGVAIVAAAGAVPALLLALACALALRAWRRRRREHALAGARGAV